MALKVMKEKRSKYFWLLFLCTNLTASINAPFINGYLPNTTPDGSEILKITGPCKDGLNADNYYFYGGILNSFAKQLQIGINIRGT